MGIFRKRPLAAGCFCFILSVLLFSLFSNQSFLAPVSASLCVAGLAVTVAIRKRRPYLSLYLALLFLGVLGGAGRIVLDRLLYAPLTEAVGTEITATVKVLEVSYESSYQSEYEVKVKNIEGRKATGSAVLRTTGDFALKEGDTMIAEFSVHDLSFEAFYDGQAYRYSGNGNRVILVPEKVSDVFPEETPGIFSRIKELKRQSAARLRAVLNGEAGNFAAALLFGETKDLNEVTVRNFRRSGISHLLAISGLHLAVIAGAADRLLSILRIGKRSRILFISLFCVFYFFLTGCSYSTLRAMLILLFVYLAFLLHKDSDSLTALLCAGALILAAAPYAVFSTSYQMTMLATFGILTFGKMLAFSEKFFPRWRGMPGIFMSICRAAVSSLAVTFCATIAILPIQWITFGELSLVSPLANLCILPLSAPFLIGSMLSFLLSSVPILSLLTAYPVRELANLIFCLTERFSEMNNAMLSLRYSFCAYILIPAYAILLLFLVLDLKKFAALSLSPVALAAIAFVICLAAGGKLDHERIEISYFQSGTKETLLFFGGGKGMLCDVSGGSENHWNDSYKVLQSMGATEINVILLTQYYDAAPSTLSSFAARVLVREIWVPEPKNDEERRILALICEGAVKYGVALTVYQRDVPLRVFYSAEVIVSEPLYETRSVKPALTLLLENDSGSFLYMSAAYSEYFFHRSENASLPQGDILMLGSAGPNPHEPIRLPLYASQVILTDEVQLKLLEIEENRHYYCFPEKFHAVLD